jgi:hypothetical protein
MGGLPLSSSSGAILATTARHGMESNFTDRIIRWRSEGRKDYERHFEVFGNRCDVHCWAGDFSCTVDAARIVSTNLQEH